MMISCIRYTNRLLAMLSLTASLAIVVSSCNTSDVEVEKPSTGKVTVDLALNVSTQQSTGTNTRMTADAVQVGSNPVFRGIQDIRLIPFAVERAILSTDNPQPGGNGPLDRVADKTFYLGNNNIDVTIGTASYLCYARAVPANSSTKFSNGSVVETFPADNKPSGIQFSPEPIHTSTDPDAKATAIANYLTSIANATATSGSAPDNKWSTTPNTALKGLFESFVNMDDSNGTPSYKPIAGSSASVAAFVLDLYKKMSALAFGDGSDPDKVKNAVLTAIAGSGVTLTRDVNNNNEVTGIKLPEAMAGYPDNIDLPDGAAVLKWVVPNTGEPSFVPQTGNTMVEGVTPPNTFAYPAELYYYANSRIRVSDVSKAASYTSRTTWADVLADYGSGPGVVALSTRSIAIENQLNYGVSLFSVYIKASTATPAPSESLFDAIGAEVKLVSDDPTPVPYFRLTGVMVSNQYSQSFEFEPTTGGSEYVIYDNNNRQATGINLLRNTQSANFYTIVFPTPPEPSAPLKLVLEFENQSSTSFVGYDNGMIHPGTKFYLVGEFTPTYVSADPDFMKRVFTKDYMTTLGIEIQSLQNAYNIVPDLNTAKNVLKVVDIGVKKWASRGNEPHPVYNW